MTYRNKRVRPIAMQCSAAAVLVALLFVANIALAIQPARWTHTTEADFQGGDAIDAVVTNLGDVKLAHHTEELGDVLEQSSIIYDLQQIGDVTYIAAGPQAKLLKREGDQTTVVFESDKEQLFCLDQSADGKLLLGLSGSKCRIATLDGGEVKELFNLKGVRYIWDILITDGQLLLATGIEGKLLSVTNKDKEWAVAEIYDAHQANLLCLARDAKGRIFVGTDTDGLIYRVTLTGDAEKPADVFAVYDAAEPEIGALLVGADGAVYAGTADAEQARPGRLEKAATEEAGRPQVDKKATEGEKGKEGAEPPAEVAPKPEPVAEKAEATTEAAPKEVAKAAEPEPMPIETTEVVTEEASPKVTAEQRDQLRQEIRRRLVAARQSGQMQVTSTAARRPTASSTTARRSTGKRPAEPRKKGNAVYRIDEDGFVREVFRESVMILSLAEADGKLLVSTGNEGHIYSIDVEAEETTILADLKPAQVPVIIQGADNSLLLGTANPARLIRLGVGFAAEGTFTSDALDAKQISKWGTLAITGDIPQGAGLAIRTRSGNVSDPEQAAWGAWSEPTTLTHDAKHSTMSPRMAAVASEPARFLQYEVKLTSDGKTTPVLDRVELTYVMPNLTPQIESIKAEYPEPKKPTRTTTSKKEDAEPPAPETEMKVEWKAADPNGDALTFRLEYQFAGSDVWLTLEDDLPANRYEWETRRVPDGRYRLRIIASDAPDNPPGSVKTAIRQSDPLLVDNTPPTITDLTSTLNKGSAEYRFKAVDELSAIQSVHWSLDGSDQWQVVMPDDWIMDSTSESFTATIAGLAPGRHAVTLRVIDGRGNAYYKALFTTVK